MLRSEHSIVSYKNGRAFPDRLTRVTHRHYLEYAERMLAVYRRGIGRTRRELHQSVRNVLAGEADCDRRRIGSFCKLLDDAGEFDTDRRGEAAALRLRVFSLAARLHPLVTEPDQIFERSEREAKASIAGELGVPWDRIDAALYVDVIDRQPLRVFEGFASPQALLSRYNLAQVQACLYKAQQMTVHAAADFAAVVRYAKLSGLLVEVSRVSNEEYRIDLSGPASVLHETRRYGINFARFVSALTACRNWNMRGCVSTPWNTTAQVRLSSEDGYQTHVKSPPEFDSQVEEALAKSWGESRQGWKLLREAGILHEGQTTFVPDFLLKHEDGREVFLEVVGFWTPEYLEKKRKTIARFSHHRILLAVPWRTVKLDRVGRGVIIYKTRIKPEAVIESAEEAYGPLSPAETSSVHRR
jgi:predicted nuclease of restriction endonuclease-like RecB superfamily